MKKWVVGIVVIVLVLFAGTFTWLYSKVGLKEYIGATIAIKNLPEDKIDKAKDDFLSPFDANLYGGILAGFWGGKVWVWGKSGLKPFVTDQYSVYSFFSVCKPGLFQNMKDGGVYRSRQVFINILYLSRLERAGL